MPTGPAARIADPTAHGGIISLGLPTVLGVCPLHD